MVKLRLKITIWVLLILNILVFSLMATPTNTVFANYCHIRSHEVWCHRNLIRYRLKNSHLSHDIYRDLLNRKFWWHKGPVKRDRRSGYYYLIQRTGAKFKRRLRKTLFRDKQRLNKFKAKRSKRRVRHSRNQDWNRAGYPTDLALDQASRELIKATNQDRAKYGLKPLTSVNYLNRLAAWRAKQLFIDGFTHYDPSGQPYLVNDARYAHVSLGSKWAENLANTDGYIDQSPKAIAETINRMLFTDEKGMTLAQNGGHRKNILNPNLTRIGVGFQTNGKGCTNVSEDFAN